MVVRFISHVNLEIMLERLRQYGELHGPVRGEDGVVRFAPLTKGTIPDLAAVRTRLPPKKYLLHPQETILKYTANAGYQLPCVETRPIILFGVHPCDLAGINYLDQLYLGSDPDPAYARRRVALTLIGTSCESDHFCSCQTSPSPLVATSDLFLVMLQDGFAVTSASLRGEVLLEGMAGIIVERDLDIPEDNRRFFGLNAAEQTNPEFNPDAGEWQELAAHCLGCGACSVSCPTCACFDVLESGGLDGCSAERIRRWDNCLFSSHAQVAGGMSFCKDLSERFRYRYRHKFIGFGALRGIPGCVGCGRCLEQCPSGIDLRYLAEQQKRGMS